MHVANTESAPDLQGSPAPPEAGVTPEHCPKVTHTHNSDTHSYNTHPTLSYTPTYIPTCTFTQHPTHAHIHFPTPIHKNTHTNALSHILNTHSLVFSPSSLLAPLTHLLANRWGLSGFAQLIWHSAFGAHPPTPAASSASSRVPQLSDPI